MFKWLSSLFPSCLHKDSVKLQKFVKHSAKFSDMWYVKQVSKCSHCQKRYVSDAGMEFKDWHAEYKVNWFSDKQLDEYLNEKA